MSSFCGQSLWSPRRLSYGNGKHSEVGPKPRRSSQRSCYFCCPTSALLSASGRWSCRFTSHSGRLRPRRARKLSCWSGRSLCCPSSSCTRAGPTGSSVEKSVATLATTEEDHAMKVGLFVPCYIDAFFPEVGVATLELLEKLGCSVGYPTDQSCCG